MTLIDKLRAADGPDRELDAQLWAMEFGLDWWEPEEGKTAVKVYDPNNGLKTVIGFIDPGETRRNFTLIEKHVPTYTASIDAALALVAEKLPGWAVGINSRAGPEGLWRSYLELGGDSRNGGGFAYHKSPAIAILLALLTALEGESA